LKALKLVLAATLSTALLAPLAGLAHTGRNHGSVRTEGKVSKETRKKVKKANSGKRVKNLTVKKGETVVIN